MAIDVLGRTSWVEAAVPGGADDDLRAVDAAGEIQHGVSDVVADDEMEAAAQPFGE